MSVLSAFPKNYHTKYSVDAYDNVRTIYEGKYRRSVGSFTTKKTCLAMLSLLSNINRGWQRVKFFISSLHK